MKAWINSVKRNVASWMLVTPIVLSGSLGLAEETWTGFRGNGASQAIAASLPLKWEMRGRVEGAWDIRLPGYGQSSPVIWKSRIFVTAVSGDNKETLHLLAIDAKTGEIQWQKQHAATQKVKDSDNVSRGAPTPVVCDEAIYFAFESGDLFAYSHTGDLIWSRSFVDEFGEIKGPHGYSSSPILADDSLVIQVTHAGPSYVMALNRNDGSTQWKVDHPSQTGWSSPIIAIVGDRKQLIVNSSGSVRAFDLQDGSQVWFLEGLKGNSTASPTLWKDCVLIGSGGEREGGGSRGRGGESTTASSSATTTAASPPAGNSTEASTSASTSTTTISGSSGASAATSQGNSGAGNSATGASSTVATSSATGPRGSVLVRIDGKGDVKDSKVVWASPKVQAGYASPLVVNDLAFFVNRTGIVQCVDMNSGEEVWNYRLPSAVWASPIAHNDNVVIFCKDGAVVVLAAAREQRVVAENSISTTDIVYGVAASEGAWIVRKGRGLQRIVASPE